MVRDAPTNALIDCLPACDAGGRCAGSRHRRRQRHRDRRARLTRAAVLPVGRPDPTRNGIGPGNTWCDPAGRALGLTPPSCKVTYAIASAWTGGFTANVTVANTGSRPFGGSTVTWTFPGDQKITNLWSAFYTQTGETVAAHDPFDTNATIPAGTSASFGMRGTWSSSNAVPTSFTMAADNGQTVTCSTG